MDELPPIAGREYSEIDFILPGMLGFSLLSAAVFGVAFLFFNLRQSVGVEKILCDADREKIYRTGGRDRQGRLSADHGGGHHRDRKLFFHFTLVHGWETFAEMLVLSLIGLIVFMGFGFIISSVAKSESTIPPFANLFTLPQFLLGGTFFSVDAFRSRYGDLDAATAQATE